MALRQIASSDFGTSRTVTPHCGPRVGYKHDALASGSCDLSVHPTHLLALRACINTPHCGHSDLDADHPGRHADAEVIHHHGRGQGDLAVKMRVDPFHLVRGPNLHDQYEAQR